MHYKKTSEIKDIKYKVVSLGYNCFPRTVLTRWGVKPSKSQGELSMPFDLATYETFEITKNIENNFANFFENLEFYESKFFFWRKSYWQKSHDCIRFVHEKNLTKNDKGKLIEIYQNRIRNFNECLEYETPILFIQFLGDCSDINNLYEILVKKRAGKPFIFAVVDPEDIVKDYNPEIKLLKLPYPSEQYKEHWWSKELYKSKIGSDFEHKIVDFCIDNIKDLPNV